MLINGEQMDVKKLVKASLLLVVFAFVSMPQKIEAKVSQDTIVKYIAEGFGETMLALGAMAVIANVFFHTKDVFYQPIKQKLQYLLNNKIINQALDEKITNIPVDSVVELASKFISSKNIQEALKKQEFINALRDVATKKNKSAILEVTLDQAQKVISQSRLISPKNKELYPKKPTLNRQKALNKIKILNFLHHCTFL